MILFQGKYKYLGNHIESGKASIVFLFKISTLILLSFLRVNYALTLDFESQHKSLGFSPTSSKYWNQFSLMVMPFGLFNGQFTHLTKLFIYPFPTFKDYFLSSNHNYLNKICNTIGFDNCLQFESTSKVCCWQLSRFLNPFPMWSYELIAIGAATVCGLAGCTSYEFRVVLYWLCT